jgi:hypothetical protein
MRTVVGVPLLLLLLSMARPATAQLWGWPAPGNAPADLSRQLAELDPAKIESLATAQAALVKGLDAWGPQAADDAFRAFWAFYRRVVRSNDPSIDTPDLVDFLSRLCDGRACGFYMVRALEASTDPAVLQALAENQRLLVPVRTLRSAGVEVVFGEGNLYRAEDGAFLASLARRLPEGPFREFVDFYAGESTIFVSDAAIVVPWPELGQRLARWETFARMHPNLPETKAVVTPETGRLREFFVCGVSNTPAYESPDGALRRIEPRVLEAYEQFVADNAASATAPLLRNVLEHLARTRGVLDEPLREYIRTALGSARTNCERR